MHKKIIAVAIALMLSLPVLAAPKESISGPNVSAGPRRQVATIIFAGLAGAVLGLSTLSFYGRPQDKLPNIGVGFALGVIVGASYTTYKAATQPKDFYGWEQPELWRIADSKRDLPPEYDAFKLSYEWTF